MKNKSGTVDSYHFQRPIVELPLLFILLSIGRCTYEVRDMIIIRNICHDIKEKIHDSDKDIRKVVSTKGVV